MTKSDSSKPFVKKTERLDVRLSYDKKHAFSEACENQGDTPSRAVRRFINSYIRRSSRDDLWAAIRGTTKGKGLFIAGGIVALIAAVVFIPTLIKSNQSEMSKKELFAYYDYDNSGVIELGEISHNDEDLHRVLNIDGKTGISPVEFYTNGTMVWSFVEPDQISSEQFTKSPDGKTSRSYVISRQPIDQIFPNGTLIPTGDPEKPILTVDEFKALDKPIWEVQKNLKIDRREALKHKSRISFESPKHRFVIFDLRATKEIKIDILEHTLQGMTSKSMPFMRSVEWVEGEDKPHFVMGTGREWWESLQE